MAKLKLTFPSPDSPRFSRFSKDFDRSQRDMVSIGNRLKSNSNELPKYVDRIVEIIQLFVVPPALDEYLLKNANPLESDIDDVLALKERVAKEEAAIKDIILDLPLTQLRQAFDEIGRLCAEAGHAHSQRVAATAQAEEADESDE